MITPKLLATGAQEPLGAQMSKYRPIESYIDTFFRTVHDSIVLSQNKNFPIIFDSGAFGEGLVCLIFGANGSGTSGGASFDSDAGDEVKTLFKFQATECKHCGWKNSFFTKKCHSCGAENFKYANDTRAGISCSSHFKYYKDLRAYYIIEIIPDTEHHSCRSASIIGWIIQKDQPFFNSMLKIQHEKGADNKNLLTTSVEFSLCAPSKFLEVHVDFSKGATSKVLRLSDKYDILTVPKVKTSAFKRQYRDLQEQILGSHYDPVANPLRIRARPGNQGKPRGIVTRKNIQPRV